MPKSRLRHLPFLSRQPFCRHIYWAYRPLPSWDWEQRSTKLILVASWRDFSSFIWPHHVWWNHWPNKRHSDHKANRRNTQYERCSQAASGSTGLNTRFTWCLNLWDWWPMWCSACRPVTADFRRRHTWRKTPWSCRSPYWCIPHLFLCRVRRLFWSLWNMATFCSQLCGASSWFSFMQCQPFRPTQFQERWPFRLSDLHHDWYFRALSPRD